MFYTVYLKVLMAHNREKKSEYLFFLIRHEEKRKFSFSCLHYHRSKTNLHAKRREGPVSFCVKSIHY